jgi:curved DNA-binding protein CbpA
MHLNDEPLSLYDVLELTPDATPQEIRSAYLRLKSSYGKDNIAHYTVFSREETETMLANIENAYLTLSNPERRRNYDQGQGFHEGQAPQSFTFGGDTSSTAAPMLGQGGMESASSLASMTLRPNPSSSVESSSSGSDLDSVIQNEQNWTGAALRRVREAKRITLEDLSDYTRISRSYLQALEEEDFNKLPALVYVRGFLQQVSRRLKLPGDTVSIAYLARLKNARPDK